MCVHLLMKVCAVQSTQYVFSLFCQQYVIMKLFVTRGVFALCCIYLLFALRKCLHNIKLNCCVLIVWTVSIIVHIVLFVYIRVIHALLVVVCEQTNYTCRCNIQCLRINKPISVSLFNTSNDLQFYHSIRISCAQVAFYGYLIRSQS